MARYQQGIGMPETLGPKLGVWKEPTAPAFKPFSMPNITAGTNRNYGDAPQYVDTWKSRWEPKQGSLMAPTAQTKAWGRAQARARASSRGTDPDGPITRPPTSRTFDRDPAHSPDTRRSMWD
jgi:hypothetical protein